MNEISKFGITFKRLTVAQLEMVRQWRNSDDVRPYMQHQSVISESDQLKWFRSIDNSANYYFVVCVDESPLGIFNLKNVDLIAHSAETGSFLKDRSIWETGIGVRASLLLLYFAFDILELEYLYCEVLSVNSKMIHYNKQLGFRADQDSRNDKITRLVLYKDWHLNSVGYRLGPYLEKNPPSVL